MFRFMAAIILSMGMVFPVLAEETVDVENRDATLTDQQVRAIRAQVMREYEKLRTLLRSDVGPVTLIIRKKGVGRHFPPNQIVIPSAQVRNGRAVSAHELTHLLAQGWANGLLKEGLAVYGQDRIGEQPAWPNFGQDIHQAAWAEIVVPNADVRGPGDANRVLSTPNPGKTALRLAAYRVAGSWVKWLIEEQMNGDISRFMQVLYRSGSYRKALGKSFQELRPLWKTFVTSRR